MADVVKQGWLVKSPPPGAMKGWKRRYFRFRKASASGRPRLEYFASVKEVEKNAPKGVIDLSSCQSVEPGACDPQHQKFIFKVTLPSRVFQLMAASEMEMQQWIAAICGEIFPTQPNVASPAMPATQQQPAASLNADMRGSIRPRIAPPSNPAPDSAPPPRMSFSQKKRPQHLAGPNKKSHHPKPLDTYPWLYGQLSREQAEELLRDYGMGTGLFLVRESKSKRGAYAISVCYKGRIVHHLVTLETGQGYFLNGKNLPGCNSVGAVVELLRQKQPEPLNWRSPLKVCPAEIDASGGPAPAIQEPPPRQELSSSALAQPAAKQTKPVSANAFIKASPEAEQLGFSGGGSCIVKCTDSSFCVCTTDGNVTCAWPFGGIAQLAIGADSFHVTIADQQPHPGCYKFDSPQTPTFVAALQPKVDVLRVVALRTPPRPAPRPQSYAPESSTEKPPVAAKPVSASVREKRFSNVDTNHLEKMNNLVATMGPGVAPPVVPRKQESSDNVMEPGATGSLNKAALHAMPGISGMSADSILKARGGLKKAPPPVPAKSATLTSKTGTLTSIGEGEEEAKPPLPVKSVGQSPSQAAEAADEQKAKPPLPARKASQEEISTAVEEQVQTVPPAEEQAVKEEDVAVLDNAPSPPEDGEQWVAGCDYDAAGAADKLSFQEGDVITVTYKDDGGWWFGNLGGSEGWVPADFLDPMPDGEESESEDEQDDPDAPPVVEGSDAGEDDTEDLIAQAMAVVNTAQATLVRLGSQRPDGGESGQSSKNDKAYLKDLKSRGSIEASGTVSSNVINTVPPASDTPESQAGDAPPPAGAPSKNTSAPPPLKPRSAGSLKQKQLPSKGLWKAQEPLEEETFTSKRGGQYEDMSDTLPLNSQLVQELKVDGPGDQSGPISGADGYDEDDPEKQDDTYTEMVLQRGGSIPGSIDDPSNTPEEDIDGEYDTADDLEQVRLSISGRRGMRPSISLPSQRHKVRDMPAELRDKVLNKVHTGSIKHSDAAALIDKWESGAEIDV